MGDMEKKEQLKHEGKQLPAHRVIFNITKNIGLLLTVRNPTQVFPSKWPDIQKELEKRRMQIKFIKVEWKFPDKGGVMYNTDGPSRGNPGISSWAYCLRDENGDIIQAEGAKMEEATRS